MPAPIPHKPALRDFLRSHGNVSHSEPALRDLVSTMLLCAERCTEVCRYLVFPPLSTVVLPLQEHQYQGTGLGSAFSRAGFPAQRWFWEPSL